MPDWKREIRKRLAELIRIHSTMFEPITFGYRGDIVRLVLRDGLTVSIAGIAIGLVGAYGLTRFISSLLFNVSPTDPIIFTIVCATLVTVALATCLVPARRAMRVDPMIALRYE